MHFETKFTKKEGASELKIEEVTGIRRVATLHIALTDEEAIQYQRALDNAFYNLRAARSALSKDEYAALPQLKAAGKKGDKEEAME